MTSQLERRTLRWRQWEELARPSVRTTFCQNEIDPSLLVAADGLDDCGNSLFRQTVGAEHDGHLFGLVLRHLDRRLLLGRPLRGVMFSIGLGPSVWYRRFMAALS